jgi:hypothetical protein
MTPNSFTFLYAREPSNFDELALLSLSCIPTQFVDALVRLISDTIVYQAVCFQRAVVELAQPLDLCHQLLGCIPAIHQDNRKRQLLSKNRTPEHRLDMV